MADVQVYVTRTCGYCRMVKRLLEAKGVAYVEIDVSNDPVKRAWLKKTTGQRTVPQVFIDGKPYGGFSDLLALDQESKLRPLTCSRHARKSERAKAVPLHPSVKRIQHIGSTKTNP